MIKSIRVSPAQQSDGDGDGDGIDSFVTARPAYGPTAGGWKFCLKIIEIRHPSSSWSSILQTLQTKQIKKRTQHFHFHLHLLLTIYHLTIALIDAINLWYNKEVDDLLDMMEGIINS